MHRKSLAEYLVQVKNLNEDDITFTGMGEREPIADNSTADGRDQNRRVEIRLYNKKNSGD